MRRLLITLLLFIIFPLVGEDAAWLNAILPQLDAAKGRLELAMPGSQSERSGTEAVVVDRLWAQLPATEQARVLDKRQLVLIRVTELGLPMMKHRLPAGDGTLRADQLLRVRFQLTQLACPESHGLVSLVDGRLLAFWWEGG